MKRRKEQGQAFSSIMCILIIRVVQERNILLSRLSFSFSSKCKCRCRCDDDDKKKNSTCFRYVCEAVFALILRRWRGALLDLDA